MVGVFPVLYLGYKFDILKFRKRTRIFKPEEVDLYRNKEEIDEYERNYVQQPAR